MRAQVFCALTLSALAMLAGSVGCTKPPETKTVPTPQGSASAGATLADSVELNPSQVSALKLANLGTQSFQSQRAAVGAIDFNENAAVQVFSPYAGRIIRTFGDVGDDVRRGQTLYIIDSPDLLQAESALIADAGQADLTAAALARAQDLVTHEGMAQKDFQQAVSDQMGAEAALKAARDAVRIFGKSDADIDAIIAKRRVDSTLVIASPISGRITARFAQAGLLVLPGSTPAPFSVADLSSLWMLAYVPERDVPQLHVGQMVSVRVSALGSDEFSGQIKTIGASVDPTTHTTMVRSEVRDPAHRLRPGMMAAFVIHTAAPMVSVAIPVNGVVREGDGTMSVWVTADRRKFTRHTVTVGLQQQGLDQILTGLQSGDLAVVDGAILLSNMLLGTGADQ